MIKINVYKLIREPLLHFLVIGAALFFLFSQVGGPEIETDNRIVITQADLDRLADVWLRRTGRPPTSQDRKRQLDHFIRDQVLYREALVMGLDKDDAIVRRRLSQKMEYLFNDLSATVEPDEAELNSFLTDNVSKFTVPATISFRHIYLDPNSRGQGVYGDAEKLLAQLHDPAGVTDAASKSDRSLLPYDYSEEREKQLASLFGGSFATQLFALPTGSWQGPIDSRYGVHLVYVKSHIMPRLPQLSEIRERVSSEWKAEKQRKTGELFYQSLLQRYEIVLDDNIINNAMVSAEQ
ncbi:MAG: peptidyl-prolyl cis-trans isomerase [Deltaproteobacteria bacterium]|nr:peptidyl-prolyl cis-trans isomerase [Deltaproteobacteria bacterium]